MARRRARAGRVHIRVPVARGSRSQDQLHDRGGETDRSEVQGEVQVGRRRRGSGRERVRDALRHRFGASHQVRDRGGGHHRRRAVAGYKKQVAGRRVSPGRRHLRHTLGRGQRAEGRAGDGDGLPRGPAQRRPGQVARGFLGRRRDHLRHPRKRRQDFANHTARER